MIVCNYHGLDNKCGERRWNLSFNPCFYSFPFLLPRFCFQALISMGTNLFTSLLEESLGAIAYLSQPRMASS